MKLGIVNAWHEALNAGEIDDLLTLSACDVAVEGPQGTSTGHEVLRSWAKHVGIALEPERWFCGAGDEVVVAERATWPDGDRRTLPVTVATRFTVTRGLVSRVERHDRVNDALASAQLGDGDEVLTQ